MTRSTFLPAVLLALTALGAGCADPPSGHPGFASPHASPIALSADGGTLYVVNTAADTLDVIDTGSKKVVRRVATGIDPVSVALRPDGLEVWVANHISDTVSVVDSDPSSATFHHVVGTVTAWDETGVSTDFDEPVGIAFASNQKAYVALSSRNFIAVVDVATRTVTKQIQVLAQEPRAITVRGDRLYVLPFESGNQTELSGCLVPGFDPICSFSIAVLLSNSNDAILTRNMEANIVRRAEVPDRDLFIYDTLDESLVEEVSTIGTLLYGLAVDSQGRVFIAQTEARNDANGVMAVEDEDLADLDNRAFLNQIARVDCNGACGAPTLIELEPLPPAHPLPGEALATPFEIQVSDDDATVVSVAAGSSRLFTMDAATGAVLGTVDVGAIPRGLALESDGAGAARRAWVYNAVENSVSLVDVSDPASPSEQARIPLVDPTHPEVKAGRIAFNDAHGSTTETFSCASCHPDGNTDQLLWNLGSRCITPGCDQVQPRTTMPIRGLRDTLPLHWDGVPGDPFGGINAELADSGLVEEPNCTDEHSCFRDLVDGAMSGTMCLQGDCPMSLNELGLAGAFGEAERDAMAVFLRSVPYPPARARALDDRFSPLAAEGFEQFIVGTDEQHPGCSRAGACHAMPFWAGTNTRGTGFDAPTFRGIPDRHLLLPNGRSGMWALLQITDFNDVPWNPTDGPDELYSWGMTFGSEEFPFANRSSLDTGPFALFRFFEEGSTGFSAAFGRQLTLDEDTTGPGQAAETLALLARLEEADSDGVVDLRASGVRLDGGPCADPGSLQPWARFLCSPFLRWILGLGSEDPDRVSYVYNAGHYLPTTLGAEVLSRDALVTAAEAGDLVATITARIGVHSDVEHPQPAIWFPSSAPPGLGDIARFFLAAYPEVAGTPSFTLFGRHIVPGAGVLIDGRRVDATVSCEIAGELPACEAEALRVDLAELPPSGNRIFQLTTPGGLLSNEARLIVQ